MRFIGYPSSRAASSKNLVTRRSKKL